jgi:regulatory protein
MIVLNSARLWHNNGRVKPERHKQPRPPLDAEAVERLALFYVGRYATTGAKLRSYLGRKVRERGWEGKPAELDALVERLKSLGYIDDAAFASARAASLQRRGYGERRVTQALHAAGIGEEDAADANELTREGALKAALRFAERKRIGPFAAAEPDREGRQKAFAAMMRAGHSTDVVRRVLNASPGEIPDLDNI